MSVLFAIGKMSRIHVAGFRYLRILAGFSVLEKRLINDTTQQHAPPI